jgi:hypothetical protein
MPLSTLALWERGRVGVNNPSAEERNGNAEEQNDLPEVRS